MAHRAYAVLPAPLLLLAACLLFHASGCSSSPPPPAPLEAHRDARLLHTHQRDAETGFASVEAADDGRTGGAYGREEPPAATSSPARDDDDGGVASGQTPQQRSGRAPVLRAKPARRFLVGEEEKGSGTDAARPSCGSYSNHIGCVPPSKH